VDTVVGMPPWWLCFPGISRARLAPGLCFVDTAGPFRRKAAQQMVLRLPTRLPWGGGMIEWRTARGKNDR